MIEFLDRDRFTGERSNRFRRSQNQQDKENSEDIGRRGRYNARGDYRGGNLISK